MSDNKLGQTLGKFGDKTHKVLSVIKKDTKKQVGIMPSSEETLDAKKSVTPQNPDQPQVQSEQQIRKEQTKETVKSFYEKSDPNLKTPAAQTAVKIAEENPDETPEKIKQMADLRMKLHMETYYNPTFNPPKKQEEAPAERVERQKQEEEQKRWELKQKEEKKKPIAVDRAERKTEAKIGSG